MAKPGVRKHQIFLRLIQSGLAALILAVFAGCATTEPSDRSASVQARPATLQPQNDFHSVMARVEHTKQTYEPRPSPSPTRTGAKLTAPKAAEPAVTPAHLARSSNPLPSAATTTPVPQANPNPPPAVVKAAPVEIASRPSATEPSETKLAAASGETKTEQETVESSESSSASPQPASKPIASKTDFRASALAGFGIMLTSGVCLAGRRLGLRLVSLLVTSLLARIRS